MTVTYTDVHRARAKFFAGLLRDFPVQWSGLDRKSVGRPCRRRRFLSRSPAVIPCDDAESRDAFLEAIGASLVFLIDWNKARKVLRDIGVANADAVAILDWAARHRVGHRGFLELGGSESRGAAVRHAAPARIGFGEQLDRALGRDGGGRFSQDGAADFAPRRCWQGSSVRLARDRIEAELVRHLAARRHTLLAIVIRQAGLAREIAAGIAQFIAERQAAPCPSIARRWRSARSRIEEKADRIVIEARSEIARFGADRGIERLVNPIEETIDELEQAAFIASLVPAEPAAELLDPLAELCAAVVAGTEAAAIGAAAAAEMPDGQRVDSEDALAAVGRLIEAEHNADAAERSGDAENSDRRLRSENRRCRRSSWRARWSARPTGWRGFGHLLREHVLADLST